MDVGCETDLRAVRDGFSLMGFWDGTVDDGLFEVRHYVRQL